MARSMGGEHSFVVSDLHLGSEFFHKTEFLAWLDQLPAGARVIFNGDIIDEPKHPLPEAHVEVVDRLVEESRRRPLVWVRGNHDVGFDLEDPGEIEFADRWEIGRRLLLVHGDDLDDVMPRHGLFKWVFKRFYRLLVKLGAPRVHVAEYAKKWGLLYRVLNDHVARNALRVAKRLGFESIACGHTHAAMDVQRDGHRYLNTGAWTEKPLHYLEIDEETIQLKIFEGGNG